MIFYGISPVHLKTAQARNVTCENCNNKNTILFSIYRNHIHIFWIPIFPIHKTGVSQCGHCQQVLKPKQMPQRLKREYQNFKSDAKGPIWQFAGLFLLVCLAAVSVYSIQREKENTEVYFSEPAIGDIYDYRIDYGNYSTMKVVQVTKDTLFMSLNDYVISKSSDIDQIDEAENYPDKVYGIARQELEKMKTDGDILQIDRD